MMTKLNALFFVTNANQQLKKQPKTACFKGFLFAIIFIQKLLY